MASKKRVNDAREPQKDVSNPDTILVNDDICAFPDSYNGVELPVVDNVNVKTQEFWED